MAPQMITTALRQIGAIIVTVLALLVSSHAQAQAVSRSLNVAYAGTRNPQQSLDFYPAAGRHRPWVMTIHGGSWRGGDKADPTMLPPRHAFNRIGASVFSINYRLDVPFAEIKSDIDTAFRYVRSHARQFDIDPQRGVIFGHSAGGHLAAILGLEGDGRRGVQGVVTTSGVLAPDRTTSAGLRASQRRVSGCENGLCNYGFLPQNYLSANDPPILAFQGSVDPVVNPIEPKALQYQAHKAGVGMRVVIDVGWNHSYLQLWRVPANKSRTLAFVKSRLDLD